MGGLDIPVSQLGEDVSEPGLRGHEVPPRHSRKRFRTQERKGFEMS